jgi:hypothetical protein
VPVGWAASSRELDEEAAAGQEARPVPRVAARGRRGIRNSPKWSIAAAASCWPVTVKATVAAAPIRGISRNVATT